MPIMALACASVPLCVSATLPREVFDLIYCFHHTVKETVLFEFTLRILLFPLCKFIRRRAQCYDTTFILSCICWRVGDRRANSWAKSRSSSCDWDVYPIPFSLVGFLVSSYLAEILHWHSLWSLENFAFWEEELASASSALFLLLYVPRY